MFETSQQSEELVQLFARASAHPVSNSAMGAVYDALPNDTDFTVFKRAGYPLNFAFIEGAASYHTSTDDPEHLDERSLQHHGEQALGIVRAFGAATSAPRANVIYFDLLGKTVVVYSSRMAIACLAAVLLLGQWPPCASRSGKLRLVALIRGTLSSFLAIVGAVVVVTAVWRALTALNPAIEGLLHSFTTWMWCAITGTVVVAAGATAAFQRLMGETDHDRRTHGRRCDGGRAAGRLGNGMAATGELSGRMAAGRSGVGVARSVESRQPRLAGSPHFHSSDPCRSRGGAARLSGDGGIAARPVGRGRGIGSIVTTLIAPSFDTPGNVREYAWRPLALASAVGFVACALPPCLGRSMLNARDRTISFMPSTRNWEKRSGALPMQRSTNGQGLDSVILLSSKRFRHSSWAAPESTLSPRRPSKTRGALVEAEQPGEEGQQSPHRSRTDCPGRYRVACAVRQTRCEYRRLQSAWSARHCSALRATPAAVHESTARTDHRHHRSRDRRPLELLAVSEATGLPGTSLLARRPLSRPCYGDPTGRSFFAVLHCQAATLRH